MSHLDLAALEPGRQVVADCVDRDAVLRHGITFADGHRLILERVEIDRDAERRADLVLAAVAPADRACVVEFDVPALTQFGGEVARLRRQIGVPDSGSTAALTGASRGSSRKTVRLSTPPFAFGASSSSYASMRNAMNERVSPAAGSITYGT